MTDDRAELAELMSRFFAAVSFEKGDRPAYGDLPSLLTDGARLVKTTPPDPDTSTIDEFIASRQPVVDRGDLTSFYEGETAEITEVFGNVAHRFSTYVKRGTTTGAPIDARGIITTQFVRTPDGWRISAMAWDDERPGLELPDRYLP